VLVYPVFIKTRTHKEQKKMRKLIASTFVTLDGIIVGENEDITWVSDNFNDEMGEYASGLQKSMGAILLGRVAYGVLASFWPAQTNDVPGAAEMNGVPKYIVSRTLDKAEWGTHGNIHIIKNNIAESIMQLKQQPGGDIVIYGSANLIQNLTKLGLIDEYHLLVHPIILGRGKPLFTEFDTPLKLNLLRTQPLSNGVVILYYAPVR
jgi:dihydrofolate reductase